MGAITWRPYPASQFLVASQPHDLFGVIIPTSIKRKSWWSELSKRDDHVEREWIQWIELVAGLSAMIVLTLSLLAVWDGKSP
jgi:hypothetical protein